MEKTIEDIQKELTAQRIAMEEKSVVISEQSSAQVAEMEKKVDDIRTQISDIEALLLQKQSEKQVIASVCGQKISELVPSLVKQVSDIKEQINNLTK